MSRTDVYKKTLIKQLYFSDILSLSELSAKVGRSIPLVTRILEELKKEGVVREVGLAPSSGGRRPAMFSLNEDIIYVVAVSADQFFSRIAIVDIKKKEIKNISELELNLITTENSLEILTQKIIENIEESGIPKEKIAGIGIGMPGFINVVEGINYTYLKSPKGTSVVEYVQDKTGIPAYIDNDSSLVALGEARFGAAQYKKDALVINIGWGVGLGMILGGKLYRGNNGFAGEFSHIPLFTNGKICNCGKEGCLETEASISLVVERALAGIAKGEPTLLQKLNVQDLDRDHVYKKIVSAARKGDRFAIGLFSEIGYTIGRGMAVLIHILNPALIILSGRGSMAGKILNAPIWQALNEYTIPSLVSDTQIALSDLGYDAEIIGAAALVMENFENNFVLNKMMLTKE